MTPNSVEPLYLHINNANGYILESNENKCLTLIPTNESKEVWCMKYGDICSKIKDLFTLTNNSKDDYDEKYMKIKFSSNYDLD